MRRRTALAVLGSIGTAGTVGAVGTATGRFRSETTLADPTLRVDSDRRRSLEFSADGEDLGSFGVTGRLSSDVVELDAEIWHREGTEVESIRLGVWMPPADATSVAETADVAVRSPVEGDSSPPPTLTLSTPRRAPGTVIEVSDLDDLADETISTLALLVRPGSDTEARVVMDCEIGLAAGGWFGTDYALDGRLELPFPELEEA